MASPEVAKDQQPPAEARAEQSPRPASFEAILKERGTIIRHDESREDGKSGVLTTGVRISRDALPKLVESAIAECLNAPAGAKESYYEEKVARPLREALMIARTGGVTGECFEAPELEAEIRADVGGEMFRFESAFRAKLFAELETAQLRKATGRRASRAAKPSPGL